MKPPKFDAFVEFLKADPQREYNACKHSECAMALFLGRACLDPDEIEILGSGGEENGAHVLYQQIFVSPERFGPLAERLEQAKKPWPT